ncbi:hypothetical protein LEWO105114_12780 [Legionella worsleiensis]|nr:Uncharacterised protein [Legionella worsleiensis]
MNHYWFNMIFTEIKIRTRFKLQLIIIESDYLKCIKIKYSLLKTAKTVTC